jgi:signal transduction histidine kinase
MISRLLYALEQGWKRVKQNSKLTFLVIILFVFPILFVVVLEQFYAVAQSNIQTIEQNQIDTLHDTVAAVLTLNSGVDLTQLLATLQTNNPDLTSFRVYTDNAAQSYTVIASSDERELLSTTTSTTVLQLGKVTPNQSFTVPLQNSSGRIEQSVRYLEVDGQPYYIFSEHSRSQVDIVLDKRKQDAYLLLSLIFAFFIGLAYWINRQADWQKMYHKLDTDLQERDLFSYMIAHEFRTPLTAIKGYSSFLQDSKTLSGEERRYADNIRESAERLVSLVNDFLEIARIQSGKMKIEAKSVDIRNTLETVTDALRKEADNKGLQLTYTQALKPQILLTDNNRLLQILTNIVSNSIKYTKTGTVEVSCEADKSGITIRVKDTGMGISAEDQQKLFTPFARVGGVEQTATTGTGLGMWITKEMIELLHGSISVESIKGVGTHVVLQFKDVPHDH